MRISVYTIVILASVVLAIVFACLIAVWAGFGIFFGVALLVASATFTLYRYQHHRALKEEFLNQRYCDAYLYADENNTNLDVEHFRYPRSTERAIKSRINNSLVLVLAGVGMMILSVVIIVLCATSL